MKKAIEQLIESNMRRVNSPRVGAKKTFDRGEDQGIRNTLRLQTAALRAVLEQRNASDIEEAGRNLAIAEGKYLDLLNASDK
jgi:hypothetical protein